MLILVLALGPFLGAAGPGEAQLVPVGGVFQVNEQTEGDQGAPHVATSADGQTLAVWFDAANRLVARRVGDDGPEGPEIELGPVGDGRLDQSAIAALPDRGWLVVWSEADFEDPTVVYLRRIAPDLSAGPVRTVGEGADFGIVGLRVAADDQGRVVVAWQGTTGGGALAARFYDREGAPVGGLRTFAETASRPAVTATADGFLLAWGRLGEAEHELVVQLFDPIGNAPQPPRRVDDPDGATELSPMLASRPGGGAVLVWISRTASSGPSSNRSGVLARLVGPNGEPEAEAVRLDLDRTRRKLFTGLVALPGAGFLASWADGAGGPGGEVGYGIAARFLDGSGRPRGPALDLYSDERSAVFSHSLAAGADGSFTVLWSSCHPGGFVQPGTDPCVGGDDGDGLGIFARRFSVERAGVLTFLSEPRVVGEDAKVATATVGRLGRSEGVVTVEVVTVEPGGAEGATAGEDFEDRIETLVWPDGDRADRTVRIPVIQDDRSEPDESFAVELANPTGGAGLGAPSRVRYTIVDDDPSPQGLLQIPFRVEIGPEASRCTGARLAGLLERLRAEAAGTSKPVGINLSVAPSGDFAGIATTGNGPGTAEHHLAFSTNPEATTLLRNPARPQLVTVGFTRNRLASDLVGPGAADLLKLVLDPTLAGNTDPAPEAFLTVDNVEREAGGRPSDAKPGRGLVPLASPCHGPLGAGDAHALRVLQRVVRAETPGAARQEIAIYPATERGEVRIDVRPYAADGRSLGLLAAVIEVEYIIPVNPADEPRLSEGILRGLALCDDETDPAEPAGACTSLDRPTTLHLIRPRFSGELWDSTPYRIFAGPESSGGSVGVDFRDLLAGTTWRPPSGP